MNFNEIINNPTLAISILIKKAQKIIRGKYVMLKYKSGKGIIVNKGCIFDIKKITFGSNIELATNIHIFGSGTLKIGNNTFIGNSTVICVDKFLEIGSDTMIAPNCYITDTNHGTRGNLLMRKQPLRTKDTLIGSNVWIGATCCILSGSSIGNGSVIGAGSVINSKIEENSFVVPNREKKISRRTTENN